MSHHSNIPSELKTLEHVTLKVPYEVLNKKFRFAQKILDREASYVAQAGNELEKLLADQPPVSIPPEEEVNGADSASGGAGAVALAGKKPKGPNGKEVAKLLGVLADRLGSLKRKAGESIHDELETAKGVKQRVNHLKSSVSVSGDSLCKHVDSGMSRNMREKQWKRVRLNRMLVDHLLREGMYDSAKLLAEDLNIKDLTNVEVFWAAKEVEESLQRHETSRMVAWCYENKSKLRKIKSTLELEIRMQEFVELVRGGRRTDAVKHARKYLADNEPEHIAAVKKCMGLLAFQTNTTVAPYAELFSQDRWKHLVNHFRHEHARLYQLSSSSVLGAVVQAGLASLKTPQCYRAAMKNPNCPVCTEPLSILASSLPFAHCAHSQLVCAISGESLNENNPPLVLPSGYVYGTHSLQDMAKNNGGKVICPRTSKVFNFSEAEKVYVM